MQQRPGDVEAVTGAGGAGGGDFAADIDQAGSRIVFEHQAAVGVDAVITAAAGQFSS